MGYRTPLESRIAKKTTRAILEFGMVEDGDRVMVGLSGGKDSWALLEMLHVLRQRAPIRFSIIAVNVDSGYKEYKHDLIRSTCDARGWDLRIEHTSIGEVMDDLLEADATPCSLCARLRRGVLYRIAAEVGATKIALGHHADDFIETLLINLFFAGATKAMPARLLSDDGRHVVVRPFVYVSEDEAASLHEGSRPSRDRVLLSGVRRSEPAAAADEAAADAARTRAPGREGVAAEGAWQCDAPAPARPTAQPAAWRVAGTSTAAADAGTVNAADHSRSGMTPKPANAGPVAVTPSPARLRVSSRSSCSMRPPVRRAEAAISGSGRRSGDLRESRVRRDHPSRGMRAVLQRVTGARVTVEDREVGAIGRGIVALVGVEQGDGPADADYIARKIRDLRIFEDADRPHEPRAG